MRDLDAEHFSDRLGKVGRGAFDRVVGIGDRVRDEAAGDDVSDDAGLADVGGKPAGDLSIVGLDGNVGGGDGARGGCERHGRPEPAEDFKQTACQTSLSESSARSAHTPPGGPCARLRRPGKAASHPLLTRFSP